MLIGVRERMVQLGIGEAAGVVCAREREEGFVAAGELVERLPHTAKLRTSEGDDAVALGKAGRDLRRRDPASVHLRQVFVGRPTGDGAALSDVDGNGVVAELR